EPSARTDTDRRKPVKVPDFITRLERAPDIGEYDCTAAGCTASRGTCTAAPDYTTFGGDIVATPRGGGGSPEEDAVTFESITRDTRSGAEVSNGYSCRVPGTPAPRAPGAAAAESGAAPEPVEIIVTRSDFAKLPVE